MFTPKQIAQLNLYHQQGYQFVVAYSGGVDSTVLLYLLNDFCRKINTPLTAIHIHHGISANADYWLEHCKAVTAELNVELTTVRVSINKGPRQSLEALARDARYQAIVEHTNNKSIIFTGQHLDDQTETFLLRLKRGSGPNGLASMREVRNLAGERVLLRPLLQVSRADIEQYAIEHKIRWIEDESNNDQNFDRNFLRKQIIPQLNKKWPQFNQMVQRSAQLCHDYQLLANELAELDSQNCIDAQGCLIVERCLSLSETRINNIVRYWLDQHCISMPSSKQMEQIRYAMQSKSDAQPIVRIAGAELRRFNGKLYILQQVDLEWILHDNADITIEVDSPIVINTAQGRALTIAKVTEGNRVRLPHKDEVVSIRYKVKSSTKCSPHYRQQSRTIKKLLQELSVEPWFRHKIPYLYYDDNCVAALGYWIEKTYLVDENSHSNLTGLGWFIEEGFTKHESNSRSVSL
ncbi:tRNA(Ile)-lysidine synthetase [Catenovulum agarivorans DS-2]|uniref:tRNA(Ile)-lysidine synthase n=1 Tax=Catenovulum agarivorans DS-2 TaxID=1328313 RepID=W7QQN2_9ALTE|nr:tRNA lysidine(34) synthetase TilS [Catenovulum agarivorans]EWH11302.1 tRNA(Ile)-lysidine synthetase [Catenovulum agarivorans DS-2]